MDKVVLFAVAGSGKTSKIINDLDVTEKSLILTYTENNTTNLKNRIRFKFGHIPENITILTYFTFLHSFCYKPFLSDLMKTKGINFNPPPSMTLRFKRTDRAFYVDKQQYLYHNRIAKLLEAANVLGDVNNRLSKYFTRLYIDEIQDFGGHDFTLLTNILKADLKILLVGDFYQYTFDTSRDGKTNSSLHDDFKKYKKTFENNGATIDTNSLEKSHRCSPSVCDFITNHLGIHISSHRSDTTKVEFISDKEAVREILNNPDTVKLFYQSHQKYDCNSNNWGATKGEDHYLDVCVVLNPTTLKLFEQGKLSDLPPKTKNKLYVACSRAKGNLYFVPESHAKLSHLKKN